MKRVRNPEEVINSKLIEPGSRIYAAGNAATPQHLLSQLATDESIHQIELIGVMLLGDIKDLFSEDSCRRITHRVIFNGPASRDATNQGRAKYQLLHLSDIPRQVRYHLKPNIAMITVSGPDNGGNYSLGTTAEAVPAAVETVKQKGGVVIAERNNRMPFVLGGTIPGDMIDYMLDTDYPLPVSPVKPPDEAAKRIGRLIARHFVCDGATLQYGIGQVPEAVTDAILAKEVKDLGIHTELFADGMQRLVEVGVVSNRHTFTQANFAMSSIFLASNQEGYDWLDYNSSVQSRPCDYTNNVLNIAREPCMVAINGAIGVDLHGNIWADSLQARKIYSGVGGQSDFLRGAALSNGGVPIIALKSTTANGTSKIVDKCPAGITTTAIAADQVVIVTEHGAFDPRGLAFSERAVAIAHLAEPQVRQQLLKTIYDSPVWHHPNEALKDGVPRGVIPYEKL
ncbi:MAG: malonate decarboxylase subunit alpha [Desulfobacterales bacterium]|nr:malonate decarboxylase subunit alpha [Desulfobacterales bacterium]